MHHSATDAVDVYRVRRSQLHITGIGLTIGSRVCTIRVVVGGAIEHDARFAGDADIALLGVHICQTDGVACNGQRAQVSTSAIVFTQGDIACRRTLTGHDAQRVSTWSSAQAAYGAAGAADADCGGIGCESIGGVDDHIATNGNRSGDIYRTRRSGDIASQFHALSCSTCHTGARDCHRTTSHGCGVDSTQQSAGIASIEIDTRIPGIGVCGFNVRVLARRTKTHLAKARLNLAEIGTGDV